MTIRTLGVILTALGVAGIVATIAQGPSGQSLALYAFTLLAAGFVLVTLDTVRKFAAGPMGRTLVKQPRQRKSAARRDKKEEKDA
ncbi:MAG: hypothetical protein AAFO70_05755 [Pseudomonadota bacterium]